MIGILRPNGAVCGVEKRRGNLVPAGPRGVSGYSRVDRGLYTCYSTHYNRYEMVGGENPRGQVDVESNGKKRVIVVGAGAAGLAIAGRLASKESVERVVVLEKNSCVGGRLQSEEMDGYRFDTGPSLLLFPRVYKETFEALGVDTSELDLRLVSPAAYRVFFPDGDSIDLLGDEDAMAEAMEQREKGAGDGYRRFLRIARNNLELGMPYFIEQDFTHLSDAKGLLDLLPKATSLNPWHLLGPYDLVLREFFKDARLRAAVTFQTLYVGLTPYNAPGVFSLLVGTEMNDGVYYPMGGFQTIRDAIERAVVDAGVEICTDHEVARILVRDDMSVCGVELAGSGKRIEADIVVCNRDLPAAYSLIDDEQADISSNAKRYGERKTAQLASLQYSSGIIAFNWCFDRKLDDSLLHHNIFLSDKPRKAWKLARDADELQEWPNFYCHMPSKTDPSAAPPGCESVMVLLPVANMQKLRDPSGYDELIRKGRETVVRYMAKVTGIPDLEKHIVGEQVIDPVAWEQLYGLKFGSAFGLAHGLDQLSLFRPANKDPTVSGLYFTGASTRPGNGVPLCFISAKLCSERIMHDLHASSP